MKSKIITSCTAPAQACKLTPVAPCVMKSQVQDLPQLHHENTDSAGSTTHDSSDALRSCNKTASSSQYFLLSNFSTD